MGPAWVSGSLFANTFISFSGAGILGLPYAFQKAGLVEGTVILAVVCFVSIYAMLLLVRAKNKLVQDRMEEDSDDEKIDEREAPFISYSDMGEAAMGKKGRLLVEIVLSVAHVGFCCAYLIFVTKTLETITAGTQFELGSYIHHRFAESSIWVIVLAPPLLPLVMLPFEKLHMTSAFADVATLLSYAIVYYVDFGKLHHQSAADFAKLSLARWRGLPFFASVAMYCYEGAGLVLSLEHSSYQGKSLAERQRHFPKMFVLSLLVVTSCYLVFGVAGYMAFGESVQAVITKNLGPGFLAYSIKGALSLALYMAYPLALHPIGQILDTKVPNRVLLLRIFLVSFTVFIVIAVPSFAFVMELVGGSACALISFVLPALFHYRIMRKELNIRSKVVDWMIILFGVGLGTLCTGVVFFDIFSGSSIHHVQSPVAAAIDANKLAEQRSKLGQLMDSVQRLKLGQLVKHFT